MNLSQNDRDHGPGNRIEGLPSIAHGLPVIWLRVAAIVVFVSLLLQHGFPVGERAIGLLNWLDALMAVILLVDLAGSLSKGRRWVQVMAERRLEFLLGGLFALLLVTSWLLPDDRLAGLLAFLRLDSAGQLSFNLVQLFLLLSLGIQTLRGIQRFVDRGTRPELILAGSFATLILVGGLLLLLPNSSARPEAPISVMEAFFTSTSAVCVTGLVVRDTGADFTTFGQMVIMVLIQMGGLGIITFVAFLSIFSTRALPVPQLVVFRQLVNAPRLADVKRLIFGILLVTVVIEALGALFLYQFRPGDGEPIERLLWSLFHSISAFCNAGFAFQADSLVPYQTNAGMMWTFMILIVLGGMGFLVILEVVGFRFTRLAWFRRFEFFRRLHAGQPAGRISLQARLALQVTLVLLLAGFVGFMLLEANHLLAGRSVKDSLLIAAFQSVTPRTAGFNTVSIEGLRDATLVLIMVLMVVGASPMSMGGGIKMASFGILLLALRALITRRDRVELSGRCVPVRTLFAALGVFVLYVIAATTGVFLLTIFDPDMSLQDQTFEVISALSTVGLSTGITAQLSVQSQVVLCLLMFVGRVGPIALVLSVFQSGRTVPYDFPEEDVVVG
jgi:trk system potassium uptake protein